MLAPGATIFDQDGTRLSAGITKRWCGSGARFPKQPSHSQSTSISFWSSRWCTGRFSKSLARLAEKADGLRTVDLGLAMQDRAVRLAFKRRDRTCYVDNSIQQESGRYKVVKRKAAARRPYTASDIKLLKQHSKARTPVSKIAKQMKRSVGSLRQKALTLGIGLGHQR